MGGGAEEEGEGGRGEHLNKLDEWGEGRFGGSQRLSIFITCPFISHLIRLLFSCMCGCERDRETERERERERERD